VLRLFEENNPDTLQRLGHPCFASGFRLFGNCRQHFGGDYLNSDIGHLFSRLLLYNLLQTQADSLMRGSSLIFYAHCIGP
jgi:hypothetical protein